MGFTNATLIEAAAKHLLSILHSESPIRYSRFYDGSDKTSQRLADAIGLEPKSRGWYSVEHIIDLAVYELEKQGVVKTRFLDERLMDGEPDYEIILTSRGKEALVRNERLQFWDAE